METAVILEGARTPIGKFLGSFSETPAVELGMRAAREAMRRSIVEPAQVDQSIFGHARQAGNGPNTGRQVSLGAGVPQEVSAYNVNIACGSGMKAVQIGAQQIALGDAEVVLVGGMENMTRVPYLLPDMRLGYRLGNTEAVDAMYRDGLLDPLCGLIMGETAENLVDRYDISRAEQDEFALGIAAKAASGAARRAAEMFPVDAALGRRGRPRHRGRTPATGHHHRVAREAPAGLPGGRLRHGGQLERSHRRRGVDGVDERSNGPARRVASRWHGSRACPGPACHPRSWGSGRCRRPRRCSRRPA